MSNYEIIEQQESIGKGEFESVLCKHLKFYPLENKNTGELAFPKLKFLVLRIILRHKVGGSNFELTMSLHGGKPQMKWKRPDKIVPAIQRDTNGRAIKGRYGHNQVDTLAHKTEIVKGEKHSITEWALADKLGPELAEQCKGLFAERLFELIGRKAA